MGIFRVLDVLARHGVPPTIALDVLTAGHYPFLVRDCLGRGTEIMAHGISVSRMITSRMSDEEERDYIQGSVQRLTRANGQAPRAGSGPSLELPCGRRGSWPKRGSATSATGQRRAALSHEGPRGELHALPITLPLDDVHALWDRMIGETFETLYREGATTGRLLVRAPAPMADRAAVPHRLPGRSAAGHRAPAGGVGGHRRRDH